MLDVTPISFSVPVRAVPKGNKAKVSMRGAHRRGISRDHTGVLAKAEESFCDRAWSVLSEDQRGRLPFACPIRVEVVFVYPVVDGWARWKKDAALADAFKHVEKPDLDNVAKFVFDALEHSFYRNDKQLWRQELEKRYGPEDRVIVTIEPRPQATFASWKAGRS